MSSTVTTADEGHRMVAALSGVPRVDLPTNVQAALGAGRRMTSILSEVLALRRGDGKLTPAEYFYYRLWQPGLPLSDKLQFVGKQAQQPMHMACNNVGWYAAAADKLLFHTLMTGADLPCAELLAVTQPGRRPPAGKVLSDAGEIAAFLRDRCNYPLFAKPIDGMFSIAVLSADDYDATADRVLLQGDAPRDPDELAAMLASRKAGYVLQRRMAANDELAQSFGPRLWSVRLLVFVTPSGPVIHRATAKIATGDNPADNFWRHGNMLGAIDLAAGRIERVVQGTGIDMTINANHPDTGQPIVGTPIPHWDALRLMASAAAQLLPAIRTQSWDVALTAKGPVPLEVNFGGDLNLAQLAFGTGVLDEAYREHLQACGYRLRANRPERGA